MEGPAKSASSSQLNRIPDPRALGCVLKWYASVAVFSMPGLSRVKGILPNARNRLRNGTKQGAPGNSRAPVVAFVIPSLRNEHCPSRIGRLLPDPSWHDTADEGLTRNDIGGISGQHDQGRAMDFIRRHAAVPQIGII